MSEHQAPAQGQCEECLRSARQIVGMVGGNLSAIYEAVKEENHS